eukprot:GFUD01020422.1.p1 GENE.GFUD01020422.1~~GFUD01020422.1.p1  ORF type:complete len:114 (+),score=47.32 GFUD01020422.1:52-393(+)
MPKATNQVDKEDPEYLAKRAKNNAAIKKTREKAREKAKETQAKVDHLKTENKGLEDKITVLGKEMQFLKEVFLAHAGAQSPEATVTGATAGVAGGEGGNMELINSLLSEIDDN